jgi:VanZ family protein
MPNKHTKERLFYILMTLLVAAVIFYSSTIQTTAGEKTGLNLATLYHLVAFFMFTFFLSLSLKSEKVDLKTASIILLISLAYAISDEFHQLFVIGRFATVKDVLIDFAGSVFSLLVIKSTELLNKNR